MIGQTIGNYRITKLLGAGGMGVVYLAEHPGIGRKAAVKVLHADLAKNREIVGRFFNEARAANAIHHPGIVDVLDFGTLPSGAPYIVMEFLDGESLASRIARSGRLGVGDSVEVALQAAAALGAAHANGIVHRDLKPDNIFLVPDLRTPGREVIKVLDFGIAKLGVGSMGGGSVKTQTGVVMGTPVYMSPEQCRGTKEVDHRTDVYALAIILYEMLCGDPPFRSEGHGELLYLQISALPPPPRTRNPTVPIAVEAFILRALAKDPASRIQSMAEFQQVLNASSPQRLQASRSAAMPPKEGQFLPGRSDQPNPEAMSAGAQSVARRLTTPRRVAVGVPLAIGALVVGAGVLIAVTSTPRRSSHTPPSLAPLRSALAPEPPLRMATPRIVPIVPRTVSVNLASAPSRAQVVRERDGEVIGVTPFKELRSAVTGVENFRIESDGYSPESVAVPLDRNVNVTVALRRMPQPSLDKAPSNQSLRTRSEHVVKPVESNHDILDSLSDDELLALINADRTNGRTKVPTRPSSMAPDIAEGLDLGHVPSAKSPGRRDLALGTGTNLRARHEGCSIQIGTRPWSELWIDGINTGRHTPYAESISCGTHKLTFKRPDLNLTRSESITLREGEKLKQSFSLEPDSE